jgi:hypothetical protein
MRNFPLFRTTLRIKKKKQIKVYYLKIAFFHLFRLITKNIHLREKMKHYFIRII